VDLPDFCKESVLQLQILCTFQADVVKVRRAMARRALGEKLVHLGVDSRHFSAWKKKKARDGAAAPRCV